MESNQMDGPVKLPETDYTAVLREADPERLMSVALSRMQEETYGVDILKTDHVKAICESLKKGVDVAVRYKENQNRVVLNRLDYRDLMQEREKRQPEKQRPRAGDRHYAPGEWAAWQTQAAGSMTDVEYYQWLEAQHRRSG